MKVLFIVSDFDMGGITSSLRNLSELLIKKGHEVHILNLPKKDLPNDFDSNIRLVELEGRARYWDVSMGEIYRAQGLKKIKVLFFGILKKLLNKKNKWNKFIFKKSSWNGYDIAIGFRQSPICFYLATEKTDANRRIGFWHGDIDAMGDVSSWMHYAYPLDKLACVSNAVAVGVERKYPLLKGKTCTVYNVFDDEQIRRLSLNHFNIYDGNTNNLVTVGRIDFQQKQIDWLPPICKKLKEDGFNFRWYIVGDGPDRERLCDLINEFQIGENLILSGAQKNPYPYIKNAFSLVLTSWEAYGMVVMESLICGTPVIAARYPALAEILDNNKTGIITESSINGVYEGLKRVLQDESFYKQLKENCILFKYSQDVAYGQFLEAVK